MKQFIQQAVRILAVSFQLIKKHPILLVFPILGLVMGGLSMLPMVQPFRLSETDLRHLMALNGVNNTVIFGLLLALGSTLFGLSMVLLCQTALISTVCSVLRGGRASIATSFQHAWNLRNPIIGWALLMLVVTTGLVWAPTFLAKSPIGFYVAKYVRLALNLTTLLVLPVLIYEGHGIWGAIKRVASLSRAYFREVLAIFGAIVLFWLPSRFIGSLWNPTSQLFSFDWFVFHLLTAGLYQLLLFSVASITVFIAYICAIEGTTPSIDEGQPDDVDWEVRKT